MLARTPWWQADRETALDLRLRSEKLSCSGRYYVNDKCGSFWQQLPVSWSGRNTKNNDDHRYKFAVHANVLTGEGGHKIFTFVPKNVKTGANFGLSNLLMTVFIGVKTGNIKPHTDSWICHTDGGPDNVAVVSHFTHWLLVYLGVFNKFTWFRFKAGHSHTEVADRLFAIIKRLFEADGPHRVNPIESFPDLMPKIEAAFAQEMENCMFNWNFANWDLRKMMKEMSVVSSSLGGISSKMVYQYTYDPDLWEHGCVLVQYKSNISWMGNPRDAQWSPIMRVERTMNISDEAEEAVTVACNVSKPKGVRFVTKPPDFRILPRREPFVNKVESGEKDGPHVVCKSILKRRGGDLSPASKSFWRILGKFHEVAADRAERVPDMPHTVNAEDYSFTFDGTPRPFAEVMKAIILRFPRPLLPPNPFESAPAESWEDAMLNSASAPEDQEESYTADVNEEELRDPRRENTVENLENTNAERRRNIRELAEEDLEANTPNRVEDVELNELYLCELTKAEHGLRLGLAMPTKKGRKTDEGLPTWHVDWFQIKSKNGWRAKNISFVPHMDRGKRSTDILEIEMFRLAISDVDLTKAGKTEKASKPKFTNGFTERVLAFARSEKLDEHDTEDEMDAVNGDNDDDDDDDDGGGGGGGDDAEDAMDEEDGSGSDAEDEMDEDDAEDAMDEEDGSGGDAEDEMDEDDGSGGDVESNVDDKEGDVEEEINSSEEEVGTIAQRILAGKQKEKKKEKEKEKEKEKDKESRRQALDSSCQEDEEAEDAAIEDSNDLEDHEPAPKRQARMSKGKAPAAAAPAAAVAPKGKGKSKAPAAASIQEKKVSAEVRGCSLFWWPCPL